MKQVAIALLLAVLGLAAQRPSTAGADTLFVYYIGYDYESPDPVPGSFGEVGSGYNALGAAMDMAAPLLPDTTTNEYTFDISGLTPVNVQNFGSFIVIDYSPGLFQVFEDSRASGTPAQFGINPPNATAPSTFTDGSLFVQGQLTNFQLVINTGTGSGSFNANFTVNGGSQLGNVPLNQRAGWTFAGLTSNELNRPSGYAHQVVGQVFLNSPLPVANKSWGALKAQYRQ
jgi:hypothetical protein